MHVLPFDHNKSIISRGLDIGVVHRTGNTLHCCFCSTRSKCWHIDQIEKMRPSLCEDDSLEMCLRGLLGIKVGRTQHELKSFSSNPIAYKPTEDMQLYLRTCPSRIHNTVGDCLVLDDNRTVCEECDSPLITQYNEKTLYLKESIRIVNSNTIIIND